MKSRKALAVLSPLLFTIYVNEEPLAVEDLPGETHVEEADLVDAGRIRDRMDVTPAQALQALLPALGRLLSVCQPMAVRYWACHALHTVLRQPLWLPHLHLTGPQSPPQALQCAALPLKAIHGRH
jgi:hypothetical protein